MSENIFEFDSELFLQRIGTAIGTSCAPTYANIKMGLGNIDEALKTLTWNLCQGMDRNHGISQIHRRYIHV